jgi:hypothetical protein
MQKAVATAAVVLTFFMPRGAARAETPDLQNLLGLAAKQAEIFVGQFSDVKCTERVQQVKYGKGERIESNEEITYDYLLMLQTAGGDIRLEESRLAAAERSQGRKASLLVTNGFSTLLLIFHPVYQSSFVFDWVGEEQLAGATRIRIHFRHVAGTRSPTVLLLRGREYPLLLEGTAWLDPQTGAVARMVAGLATSMEDIGLKALRSDVEYFRVAFQADRRPFWLPRTAVIDLETMRQHWRNSHRFTDYKLFSVSATANVGETP